jgi:serine/threonine protein kinase
MSDTDSVIADVYRKIEREKALINAATHMRQSTNNPSVQARVDSNIRDGRKNISYLEDKLRELQLRQMGQPENGGPLPPAHGHMPPQAGRGARGPAGGPTPPPKDPRGYFQGDDRGDYGDPGPGGYSQGNSGMMPPRAPYAPGPYQAATPKARPNFSKLDLIKYDTPYLGPKIQLMLSQLEFKLSVEKQYKAGIEKMVRLYQDDGDRKSRSDAEGRRIESNQKVQLLKQALKRYMDLHVDIDEDNANDDDSLNAPNMRKPLTGHLEMRIHAIKDVDHAAASRFSRGPETFVIMKIEDNIRAKTRATRTDKWTEEIFNVDIDKANEIELTVYDKSGDRPTPIGFLWIRISDIVEEMRRKKIETEFQQQGWMTADKMGNGADGSSPGKPEPQFSPPPNSAFMPPGDAAGAGPMAGHVQHAPQVMIDSWFSLEPAGRIHLTMSFQKQAGGRRPFDIGLNRQGAVRQKKEEVHEKQGHKFVKQQFYNVMRCALCGEFLKYSAGMQCADCKYTCHTKCYPKVVTKCISKANYEADREDEKINHRIPHRFAEFSNIGANWCCHCGYLLPLGRKNAKKCGECGLTCHTTCQHLVPDFCGMSMIVANEILETIQRTKNHNKSSSVGSGMSGRTLRTGSGRPGPQSPTMSFQAESPGQAPQLAKQQYDEFAQPPKNPSVAALSAAQNIYSQGPSSPPQQRPQQARTTSTTAMQAAAAASGMRPSSQAYDRSSSDYTGQKPLQDRYGGAGGRPSQPEPPAHPSYDPRAYANVNNPYQQQPPAHIQQAPPVQQPPPQAYQQPPQKVIPPTQSQQQIASPQSAVSATASGTGRRIGLDHFNFLAVLGKGNFGKVMLAETKSSKKLYAIKVLKKEFIIENDEVESTKSEKRVFLIANKERHPFLLSLHACFQTETRVYFVMEYISGGDLMLHIQRGQFGLKRAQFYAAEVCLALKYFHENGVIYRDLKLDNILLTLDGHIKIADYGLCKEEMWYGSTTSTFCGTPEFMAPEILLDKKYGRAVDWWAFGVLIYQMLLQQSPFRGEDEDEIYDAILADEPLYPIHMPRDSVSILQKLLTREPDMRLGSGPTDAQEIMSHAFFKGTNWEDVYAKKIAPPFKPTIKGEKDTSNFDSEFTSVTPVLTPVQSGMFFRVQTLLKPANTLSSTLSCYAGRIQRLFILC